jgi:acetoin utilization deacetylase AcuC-like enzyme
MPDPIRTLREKYTVLRERILDEEIEIEENLSDPGMPEPTDLLLVHDPAYMDDFMNLRLTQRTMYAGCPLSSGIRDAHLLATGGTILAVDLALQNGISMYLGGGGIHAFRDHAEGFCFVNDAAVALLRARHQGRIEKGLFVSCDAHQPDGTLSILADERDILTLSVFQDQGYPYKREKGDWDLIVSEETPDDQYVELLRSGIREAIDTGGVDLILYLSAADPHEDDESSVLRITQEGLRRRDEVVIEEARERGIPLAVIANASGTRTVDTPVDIHMNTVRLVRAQVG